MSFNDELYKLVTNPENWEIAKKISDNMADFKKRLIKEFWEEIKKSTEKQFNSKGFEVSIRKVDNNNEFVIVRHPQRNGLFSVGLGLGYDGTYLGCYLENFKEDSQVELSDKLIDKLKKVDARIEYIEDCWPGWFNIHAFTGSSLEEILPSNRQILVEKHLSMLIEFTDKKAPAIKKILESK